MTYLELVNSVLEKLREPTITASDFDNGGYTAVVKSLVNQAKKDVEDAWDYWLVLRDDYIQNVSSGVHEFTFNIFGTTNQRGSILSFWLRDTSSQEPVTELRSRHNSFWNRNGKWAALQGTTAMPSAYRIKGWGANGYPTIQFDTKTDKAYIMQIEVKAPQDDLSATTDSLLVPHWPVVLGAYALAISERGEDGGVGFNEAALQAQMALADAIALDSRAQNQGRDFDWAVP